MNASLELGESRFRSAARLLTDADLLGPIQWTRLAGGANNQVFRLDLPNRTVVLKAYFNHPDDSRDRLRADYSFSCFAWNRGLRCLARPITCDPQAQLALFDYLPGGKLTPGEVTGPCVREALDFLRAINVGRDSDDARALPAASEACFTLADHLDCVRRRVRRLREMEAGGDVDGEALAFVRGELSERSDAVVDQARDRAAALGLALTRPVADEDRILSPSDFGFHNALRNKDGNLSFIDFEYAGWDDPAKTVADFFCQPERPVPIAYFETFVAAVARLTTDPGLHQRRCRLLLPVDRLKWCCILLNDFLAAGDRRRRFALRSRDDGRKARQLLKARRALREIGPPAEAHQGGTRA